MFWHLVDIGKVKQFDNYRRHHTQTLLLPKNKLSLLKFSFKLSEALIYVNKPPTSTDRANKQASLESLLDVPKKNGQRNPAVLIPC